MKQPTGDESGVEKAKDAIAGGFFLVLGLAFLTGGDTVLVGGGSLVVFGVALILASIFRP
jgi:hypothetical protein